MFHEATIKFKINHTRNKKDAENIAQGIIDYIKEFEDSAIVFIEKPELLGIKEVGVSCYNCTQLYAEEVIVGDRGEGVETTVKYHCTAKLEDINPFNIDFCNVYTEKVDLK